MERTAAVFARSIADDTRTAYARRWTLFERWCTDHALDPLPAAAETVMLYLADTAREGAALSTLRGWMAALNRVHIEAGLPPPGADPAMTMFLRGLSRTTKPVQSMNVDALRIAGLREVCRTLDAVGVIPAEVRDRAILVLHRMHLSDGAVARLRWTDLRITGERVTVHVRSPRQGVPGRTVLLRRRKDASQCPVEALTRWRDLAGEDSDSVFTSVDRLGHGGQEPLSAKAVFSVRKSRLRSMGAASGLDGVIGDLGAESSEALRDRALLLVGFAGAFRRVDLTRLYWRDVTEALGGLVVHLVTSKTDVDGRGRDVGIPTGQSDLTCPVQALRAWRQRCQNQHGAGPIDDLPVFVPVGRSGRLGSTPMSPEALTRLVRRRVEQAGLDGRWGGRSLRAGFISTAADLDIPLELIARQSRHATLDTLMLYIRSDDPFRRNSASRVGL